MAIKNKKLHKFISIAVALAILTVVALGFLVPDAPPKLYGRVFAELLFRPIFIAFVPAILARLFYLKSGKGKFGTYYGYSYATLIILSCILSFYMLLTAPNAENAKQPTSAIEETK